MEKCEPKSNVQSPNVISHITGIIWQYMLHKCKMKSQAVKEKNQEIFWKQMSVYHNAFKRYKKNTLRPPTKHPQHFQL